MEFATKPLDVRVTIGFTAERYITYTLEGIALASMNLYEHEKIDNSEDLVYSEEDFWLEILQDGQCAIWNQRMMLYRSSLKKSFSF